MTLDLSQRMGRRLRQFRSNLLITQSEAAFLADIHTSYYSQIERGIRKDVSIRILVRIAHALRVSLNDIVYDSPPS